jgi:hypothetical protein
MLGAYDAFGTRSAGLGGRGSKTAALHAFLETSISDTFTIADLRNAAPTASDALIKKVTRAWREQGLIGPATRGRGGSYRRLDRDEPGKRSAPPSV